MKESKDTITLNEIETLCKMYAECKLSVAQESELEYVLLRTNSHSPLIDGTRQLMGIAHSLKFDKMDVSKKRPFKFQRYWYGVAASIALILGIGLSLHQHFSNSQTSSDSCYLAYADGEQLSDVDAKVRIEAEMKSAEDFINKMALLEAQKKEMIDNFITVNSLEQ